MAEILEILWPGKSGTSYRYWIYSIGLSFKEEPSNYIFAKESSPGHWRPSYIGQTENLAQRPGDQEQESCARRNGATHIHAHLTSGGEEARKAEEQDLIQKWKPPCNEPQKAAKQLNETDGTEVRPAP